MAEVSTVQNLPAPFIEAAGKTYLADLQKAIGGLRGIDLSQTMGPQFVAPTSAITQEAQALRGGLGSFAPFLQTAATQAAGAGQFTGPTAYQQFTSPYQQDVISETLREFDVQAAKGIPSIAAQAVGRGVLGGGREGVMRSEYQSASDRNRAALQAQLLQQGFGQAQQAAQQAFVNQQALAQQQQALAGQSPQLFGQQISALGALGTQQQAQQQAELGAQQQLLQAQQQQPLTLAQQYGQGVMGLISGYPAQFQTQVTPSPSPLQTALGAGATLAGVYRAFS
tara:strand:+ start:123 stop:968 length:846 start_codon:yes stop_codon:yes gene_type:complete